MKLLNHDGKWFLCRFNGVTRIPCDIDGNLLDVTTPDPTKGYDTRKAATHAVKQLKFTQIAA